MNLVRIPGAALGTRSGEYADGGPVAWEEHCLDSYARLSLSIRRRSTLDDVRDLDPYASIPWCSKPVKGLAGHAQAPLSSLTLLFLGMKERTVSRTLGPAHRV